MQAPKTYDGKEEYIFISYAHADTGRVWPIVEELNRRGYRVWYDDGIDPGTEWDEFIAERIVNCYMFIAMMSENYMKSKNCTEELKYSRDLDRKRLLIYLEDVTLTPGLQMRTSNIQAIYKEKYAEDEAFYEKLGDTEGIELCMEVVGVTDEEMDFDFGESEDDELDFDAIFTFPEVRGEHTKGTPMVELQNKGSDATVIYGGERVEINERHNTVCQRHVDECVEYIKLANYLNKRNLPGHTFKVRWMFYDNINPSNVIGVEYLYDEFEDPLYTEEDIKKLFHDEWEMTCGVIYSIQVRISKVSMSWDYYFENDDKFYNNKYDYE